MDRKIKALEVELKAISEASETISDLLKIVNILASKRVETCKCMPKSNPNEKLAAYMETTKVLTDIKSQLVTDSVTLESLLISMGYIEDENECVNADNSIKSNTCTNTQLSVVANVESNIGDIVSHNEGLRANCNTSTSSLVRSDQISGIVNIENINPNRPENSLNYVATDALSGNISIGSFTIETSDSSRQKMEDTGDTSQIPQETITSADVETKPYTKRCSQYDNQVNAEQYLKQNKIMSMEDRHLNSLLEKSSAPDLRLYRSTSSSASSSLLTISTNSSNNLNAVKKTMSKDRKKNISQNEKESFSTSLKTNHTIPIKMNFVSEDTRNKKFLVPRYPKLDEICIISCLNNPRNLYIQLMDQSDFMLVLNENINATYENSPVQVTSKSNAKDKIGNNCAAYVDEYNAWYRVKVLDWQLKSHTNTVLIFLIDYGDLLKVPVEMLRHLISEFFDYPMFAIHCSLESLYPPSSVDNNINTIWTTTELNDFYDFMKDGNQVSYTLTYVNTERYPIGIDLINAEETNLQNSLGQALIDANIVKQIHFDIVKLIPDNTTMLEQIKSVQGLQGISKSMTEEERLQKYLDNCVYNETENIVEAATGYDANDERRVCKFTTKDGVCFKGLNCKLEHSQLRPDGFTTDKNFVFYKALNIFVLPCVGDEIKIYLTHITRPNEFYGHILDGYEMKTYGTSLQQLAADLKNPIAIKKFKPLSLQPTIGQIVLARNWDGTWCRARIIEIDGLTTDVFIVDYGETVTVNMYDDLREILRDYLVLPFQAVKFCLWDIEKVLEVSEEEIITYMETHYLCNEFTATIKVCNSHLYVDVRIGIDVDMCTDLIQHGFGRRTFGKQLVIETSLVD